MDCSTNEETKVVREIERECCCEHARCEDIVHPVNAKLQILRLPVKRLFWGIAIRLYGCIAMSWSRP